jgi:LacI family transcriptional regulator
VLANCLPEDDSLPAVVPAERAGGRTAARLLLEQGHRRIAHVGGLDDIASVERLRGFRDALRAEGITVPKEWVVRTGGEIAGGHEGAMRLLDGADPARRPTGIFAYNDRVAAGVLHAATRLGIAVPGDLSVVGYDDQEHMAAFLTPALTTVALPHRAMGEAATRLVLDAIATGRTPPATVRRLACPVVSRASVGQVPAR